MLKYETLITYHLTTLPNQYTQNTVNPKYQKFFGICKILYFVRSDLGVCFCVESETFKDALKL